MSFKATLLRWFELGWDARTELKAWLRQSRAFNSFDPECFNNAALRIASATNANGQAVAYCPIETAFVVNGYALNPNATPEDARKAGDYIEATLDREAQRAGVSKLLLVVPADHPSLATLDGWADFREVRVFERRIPQSVVMGGVAYNAQSLTAHIN